jgi:hypothetical protein
LIWYGFKNRNISNSIFFKQYPEAYWGVPGFLPVMSGENHRPPFSSYRQLARFPEGGASLPEPPLGQGCP